MATKKRTKKKLTVNDLDPGQRWIYEEMLFRLEKHRKALLEMGYDIDDPRDASLADYIMWDNGA